MRALVLMHSATGNTRLVTRYAARYLEERGMTVRVHDVGRSRRPPSLDGVEAVGVAFPTMYFWPTIPILRAIDALPRPLRTRPAFVLATAAGDPGAALHIALERLQGRGYAPVAAHWTLAPSNYPMHRAAMSVVDRAPVLRALNRPIEALASSAWRRWPGLRPLFGVGWHRASETIPRDREALDRFLDDIARRCHAVLRNGAPATAPDLDGKFIPALERLARRYTPEKASAMTGLRVLRERCTRCGACRKACPTGCVVEDGDGLPRFTADCVGCFACYNHCGHGAIAAYFTPPAVGRYAGPDTAMRDLFRSP